MSSDPRARHVARADVRGKVLAAWAFAAWVLAAGTLTAGCGRPTEIWIVVESNIPTAGAAPLLVSAAIDARADGTPTPFWNVSYDLRSGQFALPGHSVVRPERGGDETRALRVRVEGRLSDGATVSQTAVVTFARGRRLMVRMFLASECIGERQRMCEAMGRTCGQGGECLDVNRTNLPEYGAETGTPSDAAGDGAPSDGAPADSGPGGTCVPPMLAPATGPAPAPRLQWPPNGSRVTTRSPRVLWALPMTGATSGRVEFCSDRACTVVIASAEGATSADLSCELPPGAVFLRVRGATGGVYGSATSPTWQVFSPSGTIAPTRADTAHGVESDFNGDGLADVAYAIVRGTANLLVVHYGRRGMPPNPMGRETMLPGGAIDRVMAVGDVNGDGFVDLALAGGNSVRIANGSAAGITTLGSVVTGPTGDAIGSDIAGGDFDGDGYADVLSGSPTSMTNLGLASLRLGSPTGLGTTAAWTTNGVTALGLMGQAVGGGGDINGDGRSDLAVAAPGGGIGRNGTVDFRSGPPGAAANLGSFQGAGANDRIGRSFAMADFDGDGLADTVFTSTTAPAASLGGVAYVSRGGAAAAGRPAMFATGAGMNASLGELVLNAGDVDGDGISDLFVSERGFMSGTTTVGRTHVFHGATTFPGRDEVLVGDMITIGAQSNRLCAPGDADGDGRADLVVAATLPGGAQLLWVPGATPLASATPWVSVPAGTTLGPMVRSN